MDQTSPNISHKLLIKAWTWHRYYTWSQKVTLCFLSPSNEGILNRNVCLGLTLFQALTLSQMLGIPVNHSKCTTDLFTSGTATCQTAAVLLFTSCRCKSWYNHSKVTSTKRTSSFEDTRWQGIEQTCSIVNSLTPNISSQFFFSFK